MKILNTISLMIIAITGWVALGIQRPVQEPQEPATKPIELKKAQDEEPAKEKGTETITLNSRVTSLEQRVDTLEGLIFSTAKLTVARAERHLLEAKARFQDSKELFNRGLISQARYNNDRFIYQQAQQEMKLAQAENDQRSISNKLELHKATQRLKEAEHNLKFTKDLQFKGYASKDQVNQARRDVQISKQELSLAEAKLKAAEELEAVHPYKKMDK